MRRTVQLSLLATLLTLVLSLGVFPARTHAATTGGVAIIDLDRVAAASLSKTNTPAPVVPDITEGK